MAIRDDVLRFGTAENWARRHKEEAIRDILRQAFSLATKAKPRET